MEIARVRSNDFNDIPANPEPDRRHSWVPASLIELARHPPAPPTIGHMLYPGKRTLLSGETESLKTWLALILAKAEMLIEQPVAWVDLDDMGAGAILQRLRALQTPDELINDFFLYYTPEQRLYDLKEQRRTEVFADVLQQLATVGTRLMVIDAFNPMLSLHGLDPNSVTEVETFWREIADPIAKTGAAPVLLDHVVKNADQRGKYASGSERKASGCTVHIGAHALEALTIGGTGRAVLTTHKDRPAYLPRPTLGVLELISVQEGDREEIQYRIKEDVSHRTGEFRPTIIMERISERLALSTEPVSKNWVEKNVTGEVKYIRMALDTLAEEGYLTCTTGPRNSLLFTLDKPYSTREDPLLNTPQDDLVLTSSDLVSRSRSIDLVSSSSPLREDEVETSVEPRQTRSSSSPNGTPLFDDREPELQEDPPTDLEQAQADDFLDSLTSEGGHE